MSKAATGYITREGAECWKRVMGGNIISKAETPFYFAKLERENGWNRRALRYNYIVVPQ